MKLKELAAKPKLIKLTIDTDFIVESYGEPLEFWMWDRQDIPTFLKVIQLKENQHEIFNLVKDVVLDEEANPVLEEGEMLPLDIMVAVLEAVVKQLGNTKPLTTAA